MVRISQSTVAALRRDLFAKLQTLPLKYFDAHTHGELMSRFTNDIDNVSEAINNSFASLISSAATFFGTLAMMLYISPLLTCITFAVLAVMLAAVRGEPQKLHRPAKSHRRDERLY